MAGTRITLRQLAIFAAIASKGSTAAAADFVPLSQSAASSALNELERVLGVALFDRLGKRLLLNDSGRSLLPSALSVLDAVHSIEVSFEEHRKADVTDIRLSASTTIGNYVLPQLLSEFGGLRADARVDLQIGNTSDVVAATRNFEVDLGFIEGRCQSTDLEIVPWLEDELVIIGAPNHAVAKAAARGKASVRELAAARWLLREPGSGTREIVEQLLIPFIVPLSGIVTFGSSEAIKRSVAEGFGVSCLSRYVVSDLIQTSQLQEIDVGLPRVTRRFMLIYHRHKTLSAPLRAFIEHCRGFKSLPGEACSTLRSAK
jgi:DNA-binding transcriptional LysR family regulator